MDKTSIIIAARNEPYLGKTLDDIFSKAAGEIEVLVMLDGWEPDYPIEERKELTLFHRDSAKGMRNSLNTLAAAATGKYLLKIDSHCMFGEGFDDILKADMQDDWLVTPSRYGLDPIVWNRKGSAVEYTYTTFPYTHDDLYGTGFHSKKWIGEDGIGQNMGRLEYYYMENARRDIKIDDIQSIQGSCWFVTKDLYERIDGEDEVHHSFYQEGNELCFKVWLIGGRCVVNKNTWYAHLHKTEPSHYGFSMQQKRETQRFSTWVWMNNKWPKAVRTMKWFANEKFYPIPTWPEDWECYVREDSNFRIFNSEGNDGFKIADLA